MSITSIPKNSNRVCLINHHDKPLKDHQKSVTQEIIFMAIKEARLYPSKTLDSIDSAIAFNQVRMNNASRNQALKARLVKRVNDLKSIKSIFKSHQNIEFIGLIGWGEGCIYSGIKCRQNISSVDGFLYKDKNGDTHYQRLGSCLEYFLDSGSKQSTKKYHGSLFDLPDIYTQNGKDINFNKQTVSDGNQMTNINQWFHISKETINSVCEVVIHKAAAINITDSFGTSFARKQGETLGLGLPAEKSVLTFKNKSQYRHEELKGSFNYNFNSDSDIEPDRCGFQMNNSVKLDQDPSDFVTEVAGSDYENIPLCVDLNDMKKLGAFAKARCVDPSCRLDHSRYHVKSHASKNRNMSQSIKGLYSIVELSHGDHSHFKLEIKKDMLVNSNQILEWQVFLQRNIRIKNQLDQLPKIGMNDEGCPCCTAGLDFDEFAAAVKLIISEANSSSQVHHMAHFDDGAHWGVFLGIALPFAVIGLTAAERNMIGSKQTMKYLENLLDHIPPLIVTANALKNHPDCKVEDIPKFKRLITNLEVFKRTLEYSMCDSMFNYTIPGAINGVASSFVLLSGIWHQPFALPFIALYSFAQSVRNGMDLIRVLHHKIDKKDQFNISSNPMSRKMEERVPLIQREEYSIKIAGQNKVNQIAISKRRFFSSNTFNFTVFTAGAIVTFISIPALAVGVGAATLPIGLGMLGYGAASTGIANNIWPNKFKPRNGDCGVDRFSLTEGSCLDEIGERRLLKKILKDNLYAQTKSKKMSYLWHHCKYFYSKCITALPDLPNRLSSYSRYYPFGQRKGRKLLHKINKESFKTFQSQLGLTRTDLLNQLLKVKGIGFKKLKAGASFEQQWMACESLGIADDILNLYLQDELDLLSPSSRCGHEDENSYLSKLKSSGLFSEDNGQLKLILNQRIQHEKIVSLFEKIDYYLHFDFIEKLRYEQYALNDFFWELKSPPSKIVTKIAKKYKPIKSSLKQMKDIVLAPYSLFKKNNQIPL